jgi:hypothetical protein
MKYVLIYWLVYVSGSISAHPTVATAAIEGFRDVHACEQAVAQMRAAAPKTATLTTVCINKEAHAMHWKGKPIQPGTGKVGK